MTTRRKLLQSALGLAAGGAIAPALAALARRRTLLILGRPNFIGADLTQEALQGGWRVMHFNRGGTAADGVLEVETRAGNRKGLGLALRGPGPHVVVAP